MDFKGMDTLARHVPEMNSTRGNLRISLYTVGLVAMVTACFIITVTLALYPTMLLKYILAYN